MSKSIQRYSGIVASYLLDTHEYYQELTRKMKQSVKGTWKEQEKNRKRTGTNTLTNYIL